MRKSTGKEKSLRYKPVLGPVKPFIGRLIPFSFPFLSRFVGVLSNDFATVDVREELCYHSRPEKAKAEGYGNVF